MNTKINLVVILCILFIASFSFYGCSNKGSEYKRSDWTNQEAYEKEPHPRLKIADGLIYRKSLYNLNRDQVVKLLGIPRDHGYCKSYDLVYWLGPERGFFSIDSEWLAIKFGRNGLVEQYLIVRD